MINKKAISVFIGLTFGLTITLCLVARVLGLTLFAMPLPWSQLVVSGAMFIPALSAIFTQTVVVKKSLRDLGFRWGPWSMYGKCYLAIILVYVINYTLTWFFIQAPDWSLQSFINQFPGMGLTLPLVPENMILIFSLIMLIAAPVLNMIPSLGEEIGWRGFLLPNLEALGRVKALIISGIIWALWHTPMIIILGFAYGQDWWPGFLLHFILVTSLGIWMGEIWFRTRSTILAAFIHSVFNAHAYGVWVMIFVSSNKLVVGPVGIIGTLLIFILGLWTIGRIKNEVKS